MDFILKYWRIITFALLLVFLLAESYILTKKIPHMIKQINSLEKAQIKDEVVNMYVNKLISEHKHD